jgi:hypothetical protein
MLQRFKLLLCGLRMVVRYTILPIVWTAHMDDCQVAAELTSVE